MFDSIRNGVEHVTVYSFERYAEACGFQLALGENIFGVGLVRQIQAIERQSRSLETVIKTTIESGKVRCNLHKNFILVDFTELLEAVRRERPGLSERELSNYLRDNGLAAMDKSGRVSKKVDGKRWVFLRPW